MFLDDGLGIYATEYIKQNYETPLNLTVIDGGGLGFTLMTYFSEYERVIIVSTTSIEAKSGEVFRFGKDDILDQGSVRDSANEVEAVMMLEICSILDEDMAEVEFVVMKPDDIIPVKADLSPKVIENFPILIDKIIDTLSLKGIELKKRDKEVTIREIIDLYANPSQKVYI